MDNGALDISIQDYCSKVKQLKVTDVTELNLIIDQLNALHYFDFSRENKAYEELLCSLANIISSGNDHMLSKFCCLLNFSLCKRKIILHEASLQYLMKFTISEIHSCAEWVCSDALMALSCLLESKGEHINQFSEDLIGENGILTNFVIADNQNESIQYNAFQCLLSLVKTSDENLLQEEIFKFCFQKCLLILKKVLISNAADVLKLKTIITSLKCLQHIFTSKILKVENFGELLGILKNFLFYGLPGQTLSVDTNLYPTLRYPDAPEESQSESDSLYPKLRKQKKNKRRLKKTPQKKENDDSVIVEDNSDCAITYIRDGVANVSLSSSKKVFPETRMRSSSSDSELSDAENHISKIKSLQASVRQNSYLALQNVFKISDKKVLFGYWSYFLPEHPLILGLISSPNIFTTILKDPASQVRLSALTLLVEILKGSKPFLAHADGRNARHMSFTSLSSILATMISEIHRYLLLALLSENSGLLLIQILKCYAALSENVPYCKLNIDILLKFLKHIKSFLYHKDIQVQVACITVFCSIISSDQTPDEIEKLMLSPNFDEAIVVLNRSTSSECSSSLSNRSNQTPWIIEVCKNNILDEEPLPIKIQYLQLLSSIAGKYFHKSLPFFSIIGHVILFCLNDPDTSIQLHGAKLLDIVGRGMNILTDVKLKDEFQPLISTLWQNVLMGPLIKCLQNEDVKTLQSVCCDCLSTLSFGNFQALPSKQQMLFLAILTSLSSDSNPNVRGAAIRCLGLYCMFPSLIQDTSFLDNVAVILIKSVKDSNVNVRFKASWSLGNLTDVLFLNKDKFPLNKVVSSKFFQSVGMACVHFSKDCDRVKANAVRALGNLLNYIPEEFVDLDIVQQFINESCEVLKSALSSTFMKVCWNSCYALSNMFRNTQLIEHNILNLDELLGCLLAVLKSPNFKVRISTAQALTSLSTRKLYGRFFPVIWQNLVSALFSASTDVNFKEIKHKENLCDQLCLSICQLAALIASDDISIIRNDILDAQEMLLISMWKFGSRMTEEKSITVLIAIEEINNLKDTDPVLVVLLDILNQANLAFYSQESC